MEFDYCEFDENFITQVERIESDYMTNRRLSTDSSDSMSDSVINTVSRKRRRILSETESENEVLEAAIVNPKSVKWSEPTGRQPKLIPFTEISGMKPYNLRLLMHDSKPEDFYALFVPDELFKNIAFQSNLFAEQLLKNTMMKRFSRLREWKPTDTNEIKLFFGLILYMGLVKLPKVSDYWSRDPMFSQQFAKSKMSRNRFEVLLRMLHFSNNEEANVADRLNKIRPLLNSLNSNFEKYYTPNESICIDESMIPFRGRVVFRQFNKQKRHKYGIKIFKLCTIPGYTYKLEIYAGKHFDTVNTTPTNIVMKLCQPLFYRGHTLFTDNWYTSVDLAEKLLEYDTHLVGTIRKSRRNIPKEVVNAKLQTGEFRALENEKGITLMKWRDKRDVLLLSTKHSTKFVKVTNKRGHEIYKPIIVTEYNKTKSAIDLSDQMTAYSSPLRKTIRWYKKLAVELLLNTAIVNAMILHNSVTKNKISVVQFRKKISEYLCKKTNDIENITTSRPRRLKHELKRKEGPVRMTRKWCSGCYKENVSHHDRKYAKNKTKKVATYCPDCPSQPHYCLICFNKTHRY